MTAGVPFARIGAEGSSANGSARGKRRAGRTHVRMMAMHVVLAPVTGHELPAAGPGRPVGGMVVYRSREASGQLTLVNDRVSYHKVRFCPTEICCNTPDPGYHQSYY